MTLAVWAEAFLTLMQPSVFMYLFIGVVLGVVIGALPGLSATMGIALITPITFWLPKADGFAMMMENRPPIKEKIVLMPSARPPLPCL